LYICFPAGSNLAQANKTLRMNAKEILSEVRNFADRAHGDQMRKYTPERYIVHPVRVMELLEAYTSDIAAFAAALLHDVLEDTPVTEKKIREFLNTLMDASTAERTVKLVVELTDVYTADDYPQWNRRKRKSMEQLRASKTSSLAQTIKYADIIDNCKEIVEHDRHFANVFLFECERLLNVIDKGDPELYKKAKELVKDKIAALKSKH
jgi:(p)ppGpp synthase/HD superfamily hydrolase